MSCAIVAVVAVKSREAERKNFFIVCLFWLFGDKIYGLWDSCFAAIDDVETLLNVDVNSAPLQVVDRMVGGQW